MKTCLRRVRHDAPSRPRRRAILSGLLAAILIVTAAACDPPPPENPPYWNPGTTVSASRVGPLIRIEWDATTSGDAATSYQINLGSPNGPVVALVPASVRECYISGLAANTNYTIVVTARDAQQHWSATLPGTQGNRSTPITTASTGGGGAGSDLWCHVATDDDGDRIPDVLETDDGTYNHAADTGTDPDNADTDNDGITDGDEAFGRFGHDLYAMGARATHKDHLVEIDWLSSSACPSPGLRPTAGVVDGIRDAFAAAPVTNPDGTGGVNFIADYGQGAPFTFGNAITDADGQIGGNVSSVAFEDLKDTHSNSLRRGIYHYVVVRANSGNDGSSEFPGNDVELEKDCTDTDPSFAADLMLHLGHNMQLYYSGDWLFAGNFPNYNSVMNGPYDGGQGVDTNCDGVGDGALDYSDGSNASLDESALLETNGICGGVDIDWNQNSVIDPQPVQHDINGDGQINVTFGPGDVRLLKDHDDWQLIADHGLRRVSPTYSTNSQD